MKRGRELTTAVDYASFDAFVRLAIRQVTRNKHTVDAYSRDAARWIAFCRGRGVDPSIARRHDVAAWMETMIEEAVAPKTRGRRISALCSIYRELRREIHDDAGNEHPPIVRVENPFAVDGGPKRERVHPIAPTPVARPDLVTALLKGCGSDPIGIRDRALLRVLWRTGARRSSIAAMRIEQLEHRAPEGGFPVFEIVLAAKRDKRVRVQIRGQAGAALAAWLAVLAKSGIRTGPLWLGKKRPLTPSGVWNALARRARLAGIRDRISPHMLRVAFLTYNPAGLEAKQEAAGHADPETTRSYDRTAWRGKEAFEQMPEPEDVKE
jgi:integrase/recombinase XerD